MLKSQATLLKSRVLREAQQEKNLRNLFKNLKKVVNAYYITQNRQNLDKGLDTFINDLQTLLTLFFGLAFVNEYLSLQESVYEALGVNIDLDEKWLTSEKTAQLERITKDIQQYGNNIKLKVFQTDFTNLQKVNEVLGIYGIHKSGVAADIAQLGNYTLGEAFVKGKTAGHRQLTQNDIEFDVYWNSLLDGKTRKDHIAMDGQKKNNDGYYHLGNLKTTGPRRWGVPAQDYNCRCIELEIFIRKQEKQHDN